MRDDVLTSQQKQQDARAHYEGPSSLIRANIGSSHPLVAFRTERIRIERAKHNWQATEDSIDMHDYEVTSVALIHVGVYVCAWVRPLAHSCTMVHQIDETQNTSGRGREGKGGANPKAGFTYKRFAGCNTVMVNFIPAWRKLKMLLG